MFFLPKYKTALIGVAVICIAAISLCTYLVFPSIISIGLGVSLFVGTYITDLIVCKVLFKSDPIFSMRRTTVVSLVGWGIWLVFSALGVGLASLFGWMLWVKLTF